MRPARTRMSVWGACRIAAPRIVFLLVLLSFLRPPPLSCEHVNPHGRPHDPVISESANSLDRPHDPVILTGEQLPRFVGEPLGSLRLMAYRGGGFEVIPFQIDERDGKGNYIFSHEFVRGRWREPKPSQGQGVFSPQDELVFMASDCGDRAPGNKHPASRAAAEIRVTDPVRSGQGFVYLLSMLEPPGLSPKSYIELDVEHRMIVTDTYSFGFHDDSGGGVFDYVGFADGRDSPLAQAQRMDILDKLFFDFSVGFIFRGLKFSWNETHLKGGLSAYKAGPVRILQKVWYSLDLVLGLRSPRMQRLLLNYPGRSVIPTEMNMPFDPAVFLSSAQARVTFDFSRRICGSVIYHPQVQDPFIIDGRMSPQERALEKTPFVLHPDHPIWLAVGGDWGGIMGRVYPREEAWDAFLKMKEKSQTHMVYLDDASVRHPRENEPGSYGQIGGFFEGMTSVKEGRYSMLMIFFAKDHMDREMVERLLEVDDHPLETEVLDLTDRATLGEGVGTGGLISPLRRGGPE